MDERASASGKRGGRTAAQLTRPRRAAAIRSRRAAALSRADLHSFDELTTAAERARPPRRTRRLARLLVSADVIGLLVAAGLALWIVDPSGRSVRAGSAIAALTGLG